MSASTSHKTTQVSDVDVRGFVYALEPIRQRQQWRLDKTMAALAQAQQILLEIQTRMTQVLQAHDQQAAAVGRALSSRLDPIAHRGALSYLTSLRDRWKQLDTQRQQQCVVRDRLRQECLAQQVRLEGLERHKGDELTQYAHEVRQRSHTEQDRDWLARTSLPRPNREMPEQ